MIGFVAAGVGGVWLIAHPGISQTYFLRSATPYLAVLSAIGLSALIPPGRAPRGFAWLVGGCSAAAATALIVVQQTAGHDKPPAPGSWSLRQTLLPYVTYGALLIVLVLIVWATARGCACPAEPPRPPSSSC
jgi:hypothetical protein